MGFVVFVVVAVGAPAEVVELAVTVWVDSDADDSAADSEFVVAACFWLVRGGGMTIFLGASG